ncbi:Holliday junction branch migration protein RuvA [Erysipelothrix sp. HDW6C]|uniref:Holliday junction branch migration protein RuvA n=1 Tax=Erysipelothrix sp. HDW6C TaxID=2714930 RepID=UPI00140E4948|nr:Holliday junction branch migration protein RuvA [Erysipelothrix sp. HDW6C]QIK70093.1 Holliday junction branch migration protein RuvA [Erysipelothrix sp. HDW6C]
MIAYISGVVVDKGLDYVVVDNQGIGYQVFYGKPDTVPLNESRLFHTYQHVREDAIILFGFSSKLELQIYMQLISVKGVGPKTGLSILSKISGEQLVSAVDQEDVKFLRTLPGVGPKMAAQILLDLKGKFVSTDVSTTKTSDTAVVEEAIQALLDLGFKRNEINNIKNEIVNAENQELNNLIKIGLQLLNARKRG